MAESNARAFFREFLASNDRAEFLRSLITSSEPTFENEWLDFKEGDKFQDNDIKKIWSEALAAFANTGGGVLIFGIRCKPIPSPVDPSRKIDVANAVALVRDPHVLQTRLMQLHHQLTDPPVGQIEVESVIDPAGGGFVVCYIPEGPAKPYRAEYARNYFIRVGDDNVVPPRPLLAQLFYPKRQVRIMIESDISAGCDERGNSNTHISLNIINVGQSSLEDVMLVFSAKDDLDRPLSKGYRHEVTYVQLTSDSASALSHPLHPQQGRCFGQLNSPGHPTSRNGIEITINCLIYARDIEAHHVMLKLTREKLTSAIPTAVVAIPADEVWPL